MTPSPHFIAIPSLGIAYGRVPKVANSIIKRTLAHAAGLEGRFPGRGFSKDRNWAELAPDAHFIDARTLTRQFPSLLVFAFVRDPLARLCSCYRSKIQGKAVVGKGLGREGLTATTRFPEFVDHVCRRRDWRSNIHYRAQASILSGHGTSPCTIIGKFETIREDWARISAQVQDQTGHALPPLPHRDPAHSVVQPDDFFQGDAALTARAKARYAEDYRLFYPDQAQY